MERVAVVGAGGRESELADKYARSSHVERILAFPGNDLMRLNRVKRIETFPKIATTDVNKIVDICRERNVSLVDIGHERAIKAGLADALNLAGIAAVGPSAKAGEIEYSKVFGREFGSRWGLPQPNYAAFTQMQEDDAVSYVDTRPVQKFVIKADGLCDGKGVIITDNREQAELAIGHMSSSGEAGRRFLIEHWLRNGDGTPGEEFSAFAASDGKSWSLIGGAQDYKRSRHGDTGDMTGGMGSNSPTSLFNRLGILFQTQKIFETTFLGLQSESRPYKGILYLGGMVIKHRGNETVYVIEFNARWGDPEAQVLVPSIRNDFYELGRAISGGQLDKIQMDTDDRARVSVAAVSRGYPGDYSGVLKQRIHGLERAAEVEGVTIHGAGVSAENGEWYSNGGRLFHIVAEGKDIIEAQNRAYAAMRHTFIKGNNLMYRPDIGWREKERHLLAAEQHPTKTSLDYREITEPANPTALPENYKISVG